MTTFEELQLIAPIQRAIAEEQYTTPTPIQAQTIPAALDGRDILGSAQTGTGKTAAFALPILNLLGKQNKKPVPNSPTVLILAPTRELAIQIGESIATYGRHLRVRHTLVYGGVGQHKQVRDLDRGVHVLVATPGRLLDLMNQGYIELNRLEIFVLDEADRMLDMGFMPDLKRIICELPEERQSLFFSATLPPKIIDLSRELLTDPVKIEICPEKTSVEAIEQRLVLVDAGQKKQYLSQLLTGGEVGQAIVFTKTKRGAANVAEFLVKKGISAIEIHGNKSQNARQRALDAFRRGQVQILVATDVAARGIDVDGITHVINVDLPIEPECYVHRIGRTGRAGAAGIAISFCCPAERNLLRAIEREIGQKIPMAKDQPARGERSSEGRSEGRPEGRYGGRSESRYEGRSGSRYEGRSENRYEGRSESRPESRSEGRTDEARPPRSADEARPARSTYGDRPQRDELDARPPRGEYARGPQGPGRPGKYPARKGPGKPAGRPQGESANRPANPRRDDSTASQGGGRPAGPGAGTGRMGQGRPAGASAGRPANGKAKRPARKGGPRPNRENQPL